MDIDRILGELRAERSRIEKAISAVEALYVTPMASKAAHPGTRTVSRKKSFAAAKKRSASRPKAKRAGTSGTGPRVKS
jgi:hypothetical protein